MGDVVKLLVKLIWFQIPNTGVATLMVVVVKIVGHAGLCIGQVGEDGPVARFEFLGFEA